MAHGKLDEGIRGFQAKATKPSKPAGHRLGELEVKRPSPHAAQEIFLLNDFDA